MSVMPEVPAAVFEEAVATRRDLHMHPELGFEEHRTAAIVAARLRGLPVEVHEGIAGTGVIGVLRGTKPGRTIMLRADMDALRMPDEKGVEYRSTTGNTMHACGHDGHVATLLGAAELIADRRDEIAGTIVFCFQPAEEGLGGARVMVEEGVLERFGVERAYGLHYTSKLPTGIVGTRPGPLLASADSFEVEIRGYGGHGSAPHLALDPIAAAAHSVVALQQIVARRIDPIEAAVVSVCAIHSGTTYNVIPSTATLKGTIRAFDEGVRNTLKQQVAEVCLHACATSGATCDVRILEDGFPVTLNDADQAAYVISRARTVLGEDRALDIPPIMGAEDFSYFAQRVPACFFFMGSRGGPSTAYTNHHGLFDLDERAFDAGIKLMAALALDAPRNAP